MRVATLMLVLIILTGGCYSPNIADNTYLCSDANHTCPMGMVCNHCLSCVHAGSPLDGGTCEACQMLIQCYTDQKCGYRDTACDNRCLSDGSAVAQSLGRRAIDCADNTCTARCANPSSLQCSGCRYETIHGPSSVAGGCLNPTDPACGACVMQYNACAADH